MLEGVIGCPTAKGLGATSTCCHVFTWTAWGVAIRDAVVDKAAHGQERRLGWCW